jgi:hypothetical protein
MRFQRRGSRKRIVTPDGSELAPATKPQPDGTLIKALARAWRWQRMLDEGVYTSISEIGDAESISKNYVRWSIRGSGSFPASVAEAPQIGFAPRLPRLASRGQSGRV